MPGSNDGVMPSGVPTRRATPHPALAAGGMAAVVGRLAKQGPRPRDGDPALSIAPPEPKRVAPPVLRRSATQSRGSSDQGKVGEGGWERAPRSRGVALGPHHTSTRLYLLLVIRLQGPPGLPQTTIKPRAVLRHKLASQTTIVSSGHLGLMPKRAGARREIGAVLRHKLALKNKLRTLRGGASDRSAAGRGRWWVATGVPPVLRLKVQTAADPRGARPTDPTQRSATRAPGGPIRGSGESRPIGPRGSPRGTVASAWPPSERRAGAAHSHRSAGVPSHPDLGHA